MSRAHLSNLLTPCLRGMRTNLVPGILLQLAALTLALSYAYASDLRPWFDAVGAAKQRYGFLFSATSTALFGGLIPWATLLFSGRIEPRKRVTALAFYLGFWLWKGVEVDAFYRAQAVVFGDAASLAVVTKKICVDQFVYNPLWAAPTQVWFFLWKDSDFSLAILGARLKEQSFLRRIMVLLVSSWVVWIPTVAIVYALPNALQLPLFNLAICFWCLLLTSISQPED